MYGEISGTVIRDIFADRGITVVTSDSLTIYNISDPDFPKKDARQAVELWLFHAVMSRNIDVLSLTIHRLDREDRAQEELEWPFMITLEP